MGISRTDSKRPRPINAWRNPESTVEVAAWVRNLSDEVYKTLAFDASEGANLVGNQVGDPRTYGITFSLNW